MGVGRKGNCVGCGRSRGWNLGRKGRIAAVHNPFPPLQLAASHHDNVDYVHDYNEQLIFVTIGHRSDDRSSIGRRGAKQ